MRRPINVVCLACGASFQTRRRQSYCSVRCGASSPLHSRNGGRPSMRATVVGYPGLTRYVVRPLGVSFVVWDTETDTRASLPCALSVATDRALVLERRYGTRSSAAA